MRPETRLTLLTCRVVLVGGALGILSQLRLGFPMVFQKVDMFEMVSSTTAPPFGSYLFILDIVLHLYRLMAVPPG